MHHVGVEVWGLRRISRTVACATVLGLSLAGCRGEETRPASEPANPATSEPVSPVTARIEMRETTLSAGASVEATVVVENSSGRAIHAIGCGPIFQLALASAAVKPRPTWPMCLGPVTIPVGTTAYPVVVTARYELCVDPPGGGTIPAVPRCLGGGESPVLPTGDYEATLYQNPHLLLDPPPIHVKVTP